MATRHTYVIAEMACSHDGNVEHAKAIVDAAGHAGADAIQLQIWRASDMVVPHHPDLAFLRSLELSAAQWVDIVAHSRRCFPKMDLIACVYDSVALELAHDLRIDVYKIHANELTNQSLLRHAAARARRIDLCIGASRLDEIQSSLEFLDGVGVRDVWLMYGYQSFPTPIGDVHLDYLRKLGELFERPVGYQDHSDAADETAFWLPAAAVGMGIPILEKHLTDDRSRRGADHQAALEPAEFTRFVRMVRAIDEARGSSLPRPFSDGQRRYRAHGTRKLVARHDLAAGAVLSSDDLIALRSKDEGLPVGELDDVIGRRVTRAVPAFDSLRAEDLA